MRTQLSTKKIRSLVWSIQNVEVEWKRQIKGYMRIHHPHREKRNEMSSWKIERGLCLVRKKFFLLKINKQQKTGENDIHFASNHER